MEPDPILIGAPLPEAKAALLCLHGRGVDGSDLAPIGEALDLQGWHLRFPHAPLPFPGGGRAWYEGGPGKGEGIPAAATRIAEEVSILEEGGAPTDRIAILGFSQGMVVGLHAALRHPRRLGAVVALSGYLYAPERIAAEASEANRDVPIFLAHGSADPLIPVDSAREARSVLEGQGYPLEYREYPVGHGVTPTEIRDIREFLRRVTDDG